MINISTIKRFVCLTATASAVIVTAGIFTEANAQRDPFAKPSFMKPKKVSTAAPGAAPGRTSPKPAGPVVPVNYGPPGIEARIEYFKRLRETAVANGTPMPKVTSVLTLNEMTVSGIFKTPRGYAAMIEATPIKLNYTIYPGEKFFDGQLVAVEENRLVFRKVSKVGEGKFVASVESKPLKQYTQKAQIEGTAPSQPTEKSVEIAANAPAMPAAKDGKPASNPFLSPLDEMNKLPVPAADTDKSKKTPKKPVKIAKNGK